MNDRDPALRQALFTTLAALEMHQLWSASLDVRDAQTWQVFRIDAAIRRAIAQGQEALK